MKPLSFLPFILVMCMIWSFSAREADSSDMQSVQWGLRVVRVANSVFRLDLDDAGLTELAERINPPIRKCAHVTEYFLLALSAMVPIFVYGVFGRKWVLIAALGCVAYAALDEIHQAFVPGRSAAVRDVLIDSIGICGGLLVASFVRFIRRMLH